MYDAEGDRQGRRTPASEADTRDRLLRAAEEVFTEHGLEGFSVRLVTSRAGANVAAVNYHFGSKAALLREMVRRVFGGIAAEQLRRLRELEQAGGEMTFAGVVRAYAEPVFALFDSPRAAEWGQAWMAGQDGPRGEGETPPMMFQDTEATRAYLAVLLRLWGHGGEEEMWWRFARATNLLIAHEGSMTRVRRASASAADQAPTHRAWMLTLFEAILRAPRTADDR